MRAKEPDHCGLVDNDGIKLSYEVFEPDDDVGGPTILLLPTWTIIHSRFWKLQVPFLSERWRVVTYDGPGNGGSDRPIDLGPYQQGAQVAGALAVMDAAGVDRAVVVGLSRGASWAIDLAANHPERVAGAVFVGASLPLGAVDWTDAVDRFFDDVEEPEGWFKLNVGYIQRDLAGFAEFWFSQCFNEPHSTKQREDAEAWSAGTTPEVLLAEIAATFEFPDEATVRAWCEKVTCPVLAIHGDQDRISPIARSQALVEATGGTLVTIEGGGHIPIGRDPVRANLAIADFIEALTDAPDRRRPVPDAVRWTRGRSRRRRALYVSSPIGLGHARRDVAVAAELRNLHPDLQIDWLAQHPVTRVLEDAGERVHPLSRRLASESAHMESESGEHDLHCFQAWRQMDEVLLADFMVFHDAVTSEDYDLVIGDEAWEVDYFLHENPELKRFAYAWLTDFVGWLPMPEGGTGEVELTADYNAEMIEHIDRYPRVRDEALFVGNPRDIVEEDFGPDLPAIRDWTEQHYRFPGYVTGFDPAALGDRAELRERLGYDDDEQLCIVTVGGSGVGGDLLSRVVDAFPAAKRRVPELHLVVVAGPRIDPRSLDAPAGLDIRAYVPDLYQHLAVCDLAVVQGGLTTCMELTAAGRPFVYVPLRRHFEQNFHVHHRLCGHGAGVRLEYQDATPEVLADTIARTVGQPVSYRQVESDGASRAAASIAALL